MKTDFAATILADSVSPDGVRVTTAEATFPRWMLPELNTHRLITRAQFESELLAILEYELSRNSASSRALPTEKNIERVREHPYKPMTYNARVKGMGVGEEFDELRAMRAEAAWLAAAQSAVMHADILNEIGLDKSRVNRILEPFMWHTAIITATELENMFALRCPEGDTPDINFPAQLEFQQLMILLREAMRESEPRQLGRYDWHRPMVDVTRDIQGMQQAGWNIDNLDYENWGTGTTLLDYYLNLAAGRRLARVSFDRHTDEEGIDASIKKARDLPEKAHWSPLEHVLRPIADEDLSDVILSQKIMLPVALFDSRGYSHQKANMWCGNVRGFIQFRKMFGYEHNAMLTREAVSTA
jgi:hypothetical protein